MSDFLYVACAFTIVVAVLCSAVYAVRTELDRFLASNWLCCVLQVFRTQKVVTRSSPTLLHLISAGAIGSASETYAVASISSCLCVGCSWPDVPHSKPDTAA